MLLRAARRCWGSRRAVLQACQLHDYTRAPTVNQQECTEQWCTVIPDFISKEEERTLARYAHQLLVSKPYDTGHWDKVILNYRETEVEADSLPPGVGQVLERLTSLFRGGRAAEPRVHAIDLAEDGGRIDAHIDSVKFCGDHIIGLSLLSASVLEITRAAADEVHHGTEHLAGFEQRGPGQVWEPVEGTGEPGEVVAALLPRRSAYIMYGVCRYGYKHAILGGSSLFDGVPVRRRRRISIIARDAPRAEFAAPS